MSWQSVSGTERKATCVGTAEKSRAHADLVRPTNWVNTNVSRDERRVEELIAFNALVRVAAKLLTHIAYIIVIVVVHKKMFYFFLTFYC